MKEAYVSYEVAKLLREKGFRGDCIAYYNNDDKRYLSINAELHPLPCQTQAVACRWLREEKGIYISADIYKDSSNDADGNVVYEPKADEPVEKVPFLVKVSISDLNIRKGPGTDYARVQFCPAGVYTIVEVKTGKGSSAGWGRLKSGVGWISLDYCKRL